MASSAGRLRRAAAVPRRACAALTPALPDNRTSAGRRCLRVDRSMSTFTDSPRLSFCLCRLCRNHLVTRCRCSRGSATAVPRRVRSSVRSVADKPDPHARKELMSLDVGAYYFPGYHVDPRTDQWHGRGWTEWDLLKSARPRYEDHYQPRVPQWGYFDEADPTWGARQAAAARNSGITAFLFDWYWYEGPFLNRALDDGFLKADRAGLKFALHWANHDWKNVQPSVASGEATTLMSGACPCDQFDGLVGHVIDNYLSHPDYLWVGGAPYFSIYEMGTFISGLGSPLEAARALDRLRTRAASVGLPGVHINIILSDVQLLPGQRSVTDRARLVNELGADSVGSYVWVHHYQPGHDGFPRGSYEQAASANAKVWQSYRADFAVPYYPNVTVGWDSSPRTCQSDMFQERDYPWFAVLEGNTPSAYESSLKQARNFVEEQKARDSLITINAWNEWTEGSYLLPDERSGMSYLDATRRVFDDLALQAPVPGDDGSGNIKSQEAAISHHRQA